MGCDGGSIPRRDELVKLKKKAEKVDPLEVERIKWFTCAMSNERLKEPIVACELGYLYNKEAVIKALIDKNIDDKFSHIRSLKDLITPRFTPNPAYKASSAETENAACSPFLCPITLVEVGHYPFDIIRTCGCVLSDRAMREVPSPTCLQCGVSFTAEDVLALNPSAEDKKVLRARMDAKRDGEKNKKKERREKRREKKKTENGEKAENGVKENGHGKEDGENGDLKEKGEKMENGAKEKNILGLDQDKKGKKREIEAPSEPAAKTTKLSTTTSSSSSASSTKRTTTTSTTTYTAHATPYGGDKTDNSEQPSQITVQKTAAYNSLFQSARKASNANKLFSGIY